MEGERVFGECQEQKNEIIAHKKRAEALKI
jgi:hypothetical protein